MSFAKLTEIKSENSPEKWIKTKFSCDNTTGKNNKWQSSEGYLEIRSQEVFGERENCLIWETLCKIQS